MHLPTKKFGRIRRIIKRVFHKHTTTKTQESPPSYRQALAETSPPPYRKAIMMSQLSVQEQFANMIPLSTVLSYNAEETREYIQKLLVFGGFDEEFARVQSELWLRSGRALTEASDSYLRQVFRVHPSVEISFVLKALLSNGDTPQGEASERKNDSVKKVLYHPLAKVLVEAIFGAITQMEAFLAGAYANKYVLPAEHSEEAKFIGIGVLVVSIHAILFVIMFGLVGRMFTCQKKKVTDVEGGHQRTKTE